MDMDVDIVPMGEFVCDDLARCRVVGHQILDGLIRKNDSPAEGYALGIPFEHMHIVARIPQFHRDGEIETCRSAADARDLQRLTPALGLPTLAGPPPCCTLAVFGESPSIIFISPESAS